MTKAPRLSPKTVHARVANGKALLVCAYDDEEKAKKHRLGGALTLAELRSELPLPNDHQIVFY